MGLSNINPNKNNPLSNNTPLNSQTVVLHVNGKEVVVSYSRLRKIVRGMSKMAYLSGETNDEETYGEELAEDLFEALKIVRNKKKKKR
tara:strand:- start:374 stop:637 length:264 start_codon:yes stop_codon:yes gene_type:complete